MLPSPATVRWSSSAALIGIFGPAGVRQHGRVECVVERFGPKPGQQLVVSSAAGRDQVQRAEAPRIDEADATPVVGLQRHMLVQRRRGAVIGADQHTAGHAEMDQQARRRDRAASECISPACGSPRRARRSAAAPRPAGSAQRRSGRSMRARAITRPSSRACRPRITVSTSGSSGMAAGHGYTVSRMSDNPAATTVDFGYRQVAGRGRRSRWCARCSTAWRRATT